MGVDRKFEELDDLVSEILKSSSSHPYSFVSMIQRFINQYNLTQVTEPYEIINEAYERAIVAQKKHPIQNYKAWLRTSCLNIVREKSRARRKEIPTDPLSYTFESCISRTYEDEESISTHQISREQRIRLLIKALENLIELRPDIGQLMKFRLLDGYGWADIQSLLAKEGETCKTATLRKRVERGKILLQRIYHQLEDELTQEEKQNSSFLKADKNLID